MTTILPYLAQVVISTGILYGYYHIFLRNKNFHQYNRYYLMMAAMISICIPFLHIPVYFDPSETEPIFAKTFTVFSSGHFEDAVTTGTISPRQDWLGWKNILSLIYGLTAIVLFTRFGVALIRIARLEKNSPSEKIDTIRFINTSEPAAP